MKIFGIMFALVLIFGGISSAEAHPHANIELMESHSHDILDERFHDDFILHTFEQVILSISDFFSTLLSR